MTWSVVRLLYSLYTWSVVRLLYGREEMPARWKFCIAYVNGNLGMAVGSLFVTKYFDGQSKQDVSIT